LKDRIARWLLDKPYIEVREMFGLTAFLYLGNFMVADDAGDLVIRLDAEAQSEARRMPGAKRWRAGGPGTAEYTCIPATALTDDAVLAQWLDRALAYSRSLEPKERLINKQVLRPDFLGGNVGS
jgi:hypothetical protein